MAQESVVLRFNEVSFGYQENKKFLDEVSFSVRTASRITLMGQNGAGKSTIFKLITGELKPTAGELFRTPKDATIAIAKQVVPDEVKELSIRGFFAAAFTEKKYDLDKLIASVFEVVHADLPLEKKVKELSGGQQARLLLAHALIQEPDILLLDEPTNNLDQAGIEHLTGFLMMYEKTVLVISHDADFLNAFSDGVLYLDSHTKKVEQYTGNYYDVVEEIKERIERENKLNARMEAQIREKRAKAEVFAHKGGKLRGVAKKMREKAEEAEESMVEVRREDRTIRDFSIPAQEFEPHFHGKLLEFKKVAAVKAGELVHKNLELAVRKNTHLLIAGPNGIGKSTLLEKLAANTGEGFIIPQEVRIGYYKQDFSNFDFEKTAYAILKEAMDIEGRAEDDPENEHILRATAASFLLDGKALASPIRALSEGQKGLLSFCRLVLMKPGLLILDEPTNHINFRHLPVIAKALSEFKGGLVMVSHIPDFVAQVRIDEVIDLASI